MFVFTEAIDEINLEGLVLLMKEDALADDDRRRESVNFMCSVSTHLEKDQLGDAGEQTKQKGGGHQT